MMATSVSSSSSSSTTMKQSTSAQPDKTNRHMEVKTSFKTREGIYRLINSPHNSSTINSEKINMKISLVSINNNRTFDNLNQQSTTAASSDSDLSTTTSNIESIIQVSSTNKVSNLNNHQQINTDSSNDRKICFNVGRDIFVYNYGGIHRGPDAANIIYKRSYKGSLPTCHDFNQTTASNKTVPLLIGFSYGQVQLIDLNNINEQEFVTFNAERHIERTRVTCVKWLPKSPSLFLVAHASGHMYLYKDNLSCGLVPPVYQIYKQSEGVIVYTCKTKTIRNPIYKWTIGSLQQTAAQSAINETECCSLNEFTFSPCGKYLACASQDGFLRVYCYDNMELIGRARSYYGGLTCVCWSPDGKYVVTGGEDDLITVWSFLEKRVVARGLGHKSWVSVVAFDPFYRPEDFDSDLNDSSNKFDEQDEDAYNEHITTNDETDSYDKYESLDKSYQKSDQNQDGLAGKFYRFASVGQDTQLCFWDLSDDLINQPVAKSKFVTQTVGDISSLKISDNCRSSVIATSSQINDSLKADLKQDANHNSNNFIDESDKFQSGKAFDETIGAPIATTSSKQNQNQNQTLKENGTHLPSTFLTSSSLLPSKLSFTFGRKDKKNFSLKRNILERQSNNAQKCQLRDSHLQEDPSALLGTPICPYMNEVPLLEPTVCKKISIERLTSLIFCRAGFITSCQDGYVFSWARPARLRT